MAKRLLPKGIIVHWEEPGNDEPYLVVENDIDSMAHGQIIGVYELKFKKRVEKTVALKDME